MPWGSPERRIVDVDVPPDWISVAEATHIVNRSERTVRRWVAEDRIPHRKIGGRLEVDVSVYRQAATGIVMDATGIADIQGRASFLQNQVDILQGVIDRQDRQINQLEGQLDFLQMALSTALQIGEHQAIKEPEPRRFRWPWQKD